jgi:hypothetical protein
VGFDRRRQTAIRAAGGIFYNFLNQGQYAFGRRPADYAGQDHPRRVDRRCGGARQGRNAVRGNTSADRPARRLPAGHARTAGGGRPLRPETYYQANVAFQRDIGFSTTAEVAWVGNFGRNFWRLKDSNNIAPNAYADPKNLFNNEPITVNPIRRDYAGIGNVRYLTTGEDTLNYNALQLSVQRRYKPRDADGPRVYAARSPRASRVMTGSTEELYGDQGLRDHYYGPPTVTTAQLTNITGITRADRRHMLVLHYSYEIPTLEIPVLKYLLMDWEASGVTQFSSGYALDPICGTTLGGVENIDPSLSGIFRRERRSRT